MDHFPLNRCYCHTLQPWCCSSCRAFPHFFPWRDPKVFFQGHLVFGNLINSQPSWQCKPGLRFWLHHVSLSPNLKRCILLQSSTVPSTLRSFICEFIEFARLHLHHAQYARRIHEYLTFFIGFFRDSQTFWVNFTQLTVATNSIFGMVIFILDATWPRPSLVCISCVPLLAPI